MKNEKKLSFSTSPKAEQFPPKSQTLSEKNIFLCRENIGAQK